MKKIILFLLAFLLVQQINAQSIKKVKILPENLIEGMSFSFVDGDSLNPKLKRCWDGYGCNAMYFGNVGEGDYMIFDFKSPKKIETIKFKSLGLSYETKGSSNTILGYNNDDGYYHQISFKYSLLTATSSLGPWIEVKNGSSSIGSPIDLIINGINKTSQYWKLTIIEPIKSTWHRPGSNTCGCFNGDATGGDPKPANFTDLYFYESDIISATKNNLLDNQCAIITCNTNGENYLWSTGETTQSIKVCKPGTYTCQVTNTSYIGNQDHVASISISKIDTQDNLPSPNGEVYTVVKNGNTVYYGGDFNAVGPITGSGASIDNTTAIPNTALPRVIGTINTTISDGMGGWYLGGSFTKVGNYAISNLAHINSDYSVDTTFKPQPNGAVNTLLLNGSSFYIGGTFTTIQGISNNYVAKIDKNTGSAVLWNAQCNGIVRSLALAADQLVIGGDFTSVGGQTRNYLGAVDTVYVQASSWNPAPNNKVYKVYSTGNKLYVGGDFTTISTIAKGYGAGYTLPAFTLDGYNMGANGRIHDFILNNNILYAAGLFTIIGGANRNYVAGMNPLNTIANSFNATADGIVRSLAISNGNLVVGGDFSNIGGQARNRIAALNLTTGVASTWNPLMVGEKAINPIVNTLATFGNTVYAGGIFYSVGATSRNNAAAIDATTGQILPWNPNTNGIVRAIAADNNNVYLGGDFTTVNGTVTKNRIAQVNATTGVATAWNPGSDNSVNAILLQGTSLYVGGNFATIGGASRAKIAVLSATTGSASAFNPTANGNVNALAILGDTLYIGGDFTTIGGQTRNRLASYQVSTSSLLGFNPNVNGTVSAIATNGKNIYVGGAFSLIGSSLRYNLAQIEVATGNATSQNTNVINGSSVNALAMQDSSLYTGGGYQYYNSGQPISNLATVKTLSGLLGYWQPQPDDIIRAICLSSNKVYVGGRFKQINSRYQPYFASLDIYNSGNPPTITSVPTTSGCIGAALTVNGTGFVNVIDVKIGTTSVPFVVNSTTSLSITPSTSLSGKVKVINVIGSPVSSETVTINALPNASISVSGTNTVCEGNTVTLNANTGSSLTYRWFKNGVEVQGATSSSYSASNSGDYTFQVTNSNNCSVISSVQTVTINPKPQVSVSADGPTTMCQGTKLNLTANTNSQSALFAWKKDGQYLTGTVDVTAQTYQVSSIVGGKYTVEVSVNGCTTESAVTSVVVNSLPNAVITNTGLSTFCQGLSTNLSANTGAGLSYNWYKDGQLLTGSTNNQIANQTGNYICKVTNANNCSQFSNGIDIVVNNLPVSNITTNGNTTFCQGGNVILSASSANSYLWSTGATTSSISVAVSGNYTVKVTDANGCQNTSVANVITVNSLPTATITANGNSTFCQGNNITLTSSTGSSYLWSTGETTQAIVVSNSGNYSVKLTDVNGCQNTSTITTVKVNTLPNASITSNGKVNYCQGETISVSLVSSNGSSYLWSNGATTSSISPSQVGSYTVQVTDANGCKATSQPVVIKMNSLPSVIANASKTTVCSGDNVTLTGAGASTYVWDNNVSNGVSFVPNASKTYTVTGTDVNGCTKTATVNVTVNTLPTVIANASKTAVCSGYNVTLTGAGASTYVWDNNVSNGVSFVPNATKTYTVTGTDANGCTKTATVNVTVNSLPTVIANASKTAVCSGDNVTLTGAGASTYVWDNNVSNGVSFVPNATKTYTVTGTDANGCTKTATVNVTVNSLPTVIANASKTAVCSGDNVTLTGAGASTYVWDNNVSNGVSFVPNATKTYTVTGTDANGCTKTATVNVTVNSLPTVIANASKTAVCSGDNVTLTGAGASTYVWDNNVSNGVSFVPNATKIYTVTGTDANGCTKTATVNVTVNTLPSVIANASKTAVCSSDNVTLTGAGASTYVWDNNVSNGVSFVPSVTKTYTVTGTDANGCTKTASISVAVNSLPNVIANASKTAVCSGDNVTLSGAGTSTYVWDNNVSNGVAFNPSASKTYTVTGTDVNGCTKTATISVVVNNLPNVIANASKTALCSGDNVTLTGSGASTYVWDNNVSNGVSFLPNGTKTYNVTGTDANGCTKTATVNVTVNTLPTVIANASKTAVCYGDNVMLTGAGASTYVWDNNVSNGVSFVPNATKTYTVTGTDANGCINRASISVTVNSLPNVVISANGNTTSCKDGGLELLTSNTGTSYLWSSGETTSNIFPTQSGVYSLKLKDFNGCEGLSNSIKVTINPLPIVTITTNGPITYCTNKLTELVASNGVSYLWNDGSTTKTIKPTQSGSYFVKVTDINGCVASSEPIYLTVDDCLSIEELGFSLLRVYPNPTSSQLSIEIPFEYINLSYKLIDVAGKELVNGKLTTLINSLDVQSYSSGAYFFEIENGYKMKIIKE